MIILGESFVPFSLKIAPRVTWMLSKAVFIGSSFTKIY